MSSFLFSHPKSHPKQSWYELFSLFSSKTNMCECAQKLAPSYLLLPPPGRSPCDGDASNNRTTTNLRLRLRVDNVNLDLALQCPFLVVNYRDVGI
jgi:hypothetical protein